MTIYTFNLAELINSAVHTFSYICCDTKQTLIIRSDDKETTDISSVTIYFSQAITTVSRLSVVPTTPAMIFLFFILLIPSLVSVAVVIVLWITYKQAKQVVRRRAEEEAAEEFEEDEFDDEEYYCVSGSSDLHDRYSSIPEDYVDRERKESSNFSSSSCYRRRLRTDSQQAIEKVLTMLVVPKESQERTASFDHAMEEFSGRRRRLSLFQEDKGAILNPLLDPGRLLKRRQSQAVLLRSLLWENGTKNEKSI